MKKLEAELKKLIGIKFDYETVVEIVEESGKAKGKTIYIAKIPATDFQYSVSVGDGNIFLFKVNKEKVIMGVYS